MEAEARRSYRLPRLLTPHSHHLRLTPLLGHIFFRLLRRAFVPSPAVPLGAQLALAGFSLQLEQLLLS